MLIMELRLGQEIDIGPGQVKMTLTGIAKGRAFVKYNTNGTKVTAELQHGHVMTLQAKDQIKVMLRRCRFLKAQFGFEAPITTKFVKAALPQTSHDPQHKGQEAYERKTPHRRTRTRNTA